MWKEGGLAKQGKGQGNRGRKKKGDEKKGRDGSKGAAVANSGLETGKLLKGR